MTDETNVVSLQANWPAAYELPKPISEALWKQQERIYEALGVAKMLAYFVRDPPDDILDREALENGANALVRLLEPIYGLNDVLHLMQLGEAEEKAHGR
jgi:hypothetical protein